MNTQIKIDNLGNFIISNNITKVNIWITTLGILCYKNGQLHFEFGPSIYDKKTLEYFYYLNGIEYSKEEYLLELNYRKNINEIYE